MITETTSVYTAVYSHAAAEDCDLAGVRISGVRYRAGSVEHTIQDLFDDAGVLSVRSAATRIHQRQRSTAEKGTQLTPPLTSGDLLPLRQLHQLHPKPVSQRLLRVLEDGLERPRPLLA